MKPHSSTTEIRVMPRGVKKENLPSKVCVICNRPFTWRKKWENVWDDVTTCSKSCNRKRRSLQQTANQQSQAEFSTLDDGLPRMSGAESSSSAFSFEQQENNIANLKMNGATGSDEQTQIGHECQENEAEALCIPDSPDGSGIDCSDDDDSSSMAKYNAKQERKAAKKLAKAKRRAQREGRGDSTVGQKNCDVCSKSVDLLIRCTIDQTQEWNMVCGSCWKKVSGGVVDGDASHPHYRYGGLWKNRKAK